MNHKIVTVLICLVLVGCQKEVKGNVTSIDYPPFEARYLITGSNWSCNDFGDWSLLSRETTNATLCKKMKNPCHILFVHDLPYYREYCNFEEEDIIWIVPKMEEND